MLFVIHWKINEELPAERNQEIAEELTRSGQFPPEDQELIRWDATPDGWGIAVVEADDVAAVHRGLNMWRTAAGDTAFFEETKTAPAMPAEDLIAENAALLQDLE